MKWTKLGLIQTPLPEFWWSKEYCILPTPDCSSAGIIRIYYATTDKNRFGRVAYVDLDANDPKKILHRSQSPVLDIGNPGCFDDSGVNPSCIVEKAGKKYLYYVGYQRTLQVPALLFIGLAVSEDGGESFSKLKNVPILDRVPGEVSVRTAPCVLFDQGKFRMWYVSAIDWSITSGKKPFARYELRVVESADGLDWSGPSIPCMGPDPSRQEIGLARPWVIKDSGTYRMWYSVRKMTGPGQVGYIAIGYAESDDGIKWIRKDEQNQISRSADGWDSKMICYASIVKQNSRYYMFYNGNGNGKTGFGYAELR